MTPAARLVWARTHERSRHAGLTCRRCGISRPTLRKWWRRYKTSGVAGLADRSRRPLWSPGRKVHEVEEQRILTLRQDRELGVKHLRNELHRLHGLRLSVDTIHKVRCRHGLNRLKWTRFIRKRGRNRYSRPLPGDRVQMDVCKIAPGLYQYTAIYDCSPYHVVGLFARKSATSTLAFLEQVVEEIQISIQRIQTDCGQAICAYSVQDRLREWCIKLRPIRPRSPHLNGKVERVQKTALEEFWPAVDVKDAELDRKLAEWQHFYNWERLHDSLGGIPPVDRLCDNLMDAPLREEIAIPFNPAIEVAKLRDWNAQRALRR